MADPMSDEYRAEAWERFVTEHGGAAADEEQLAGVDVPALLDQMNRLRTELAIRTASLATAETNLRLLGGPGALARRKEPEDARDDLARRLERILITAAELHEFNSPEGEHAALCFGCRLEREARGEVGDRLIHAPGERT